MKRREAYDWRVVIKCRNSGGNFTKRVLFEDMDNISSQSLVKSFISVKLKEEYVNFLPHLQGSGEIIFTVVPLDRVRPLN
jgi:hypothetical protein